MDVSGRWKGMHLLRLFHANDLDGFCAFLRDVHVRVDSIDGLVVTASVPGAVTAVHEGRELLGYVTTWNALNPAAQVEILEGDLPAA